MSPQGVDGQGKLLPVLDLCHTQMTTCGVYMLQKTGGTSVQWDMQGHMLPSHVPLEQPRQLANLARMKHLVVTSPWSLNSYTDGNMVSFMQQAGVDAEWLHLSGRDINGNGHLMYLETNSNDIALQLFTWVCHNVHGVIGARPCLELARDFWQGLSRYASPGV